jgi:hypothetical protein
MTSQEMTGPRDVRSVQVTWDPGDLAANLSKPRYTSFCADRMEHNFPGAGSCIGIVHVE